MYKLLAQMPPHSKTDFIPFMTFVLLCLLCMCEVMIMNK